MSGRTSHLRHSTNKYDWLGPGAYFFESDLERALVFAQAAAAEPDKFYSAQPIATPAAVGAVLNIGSWLDLTQQEGIQLFQQADQAFIAGLKAEGSELPVNAKAHEDDVDILWRSRDRAVFEYIHGKLPDRFDAVRGAFTQGDSVSENSGFKIRTHIQVALRNNGCVMGWFLPHGSRSMEAAEYEAAKTRLAGAKGAKTATKKRVRA